MDTPMPEGITSFIRSQSSCASTLASIRANYLGRHSLTSVTGPAYGGTHHAGGSPVLWDLEIARVARICRAASSTCESVRSTSMS